MAWRLEGTYFENSNCDMVCPCGTSALTMLADNDRCRMILVFHIDSGEVDGVEPLTASWAMCRRCAALLKCNSSATATKVSSKRVSIS